MTTTPIGPAPAQAGDPSASGGRSGAATAGGDLFLALVQGLLGIDSPGAGPQQTVPGDAAPADAETEQTDGDADPADPVAALAASALSAPVVLVAGLPTPGPPVGPSEVSAPDAAPASVAAVPSAPATARAIATRATAVAAAVPATSTPATTAAAPSDLPVGASATASTTPSTTPSATTTASAPAPGPDQPAQPAPSAQSDPATPSDRAALQVTQAVRVEAAGPSYGSGAAGRHAGRNDGAPEPAPATQPAAAPAVSGPAAPGAATAPAAPPTTPAPAGGAEHVTGQVFPEVLRLTTSTEGPSRVAVRLNPESLGEVRVVLTHRRGGLEVSLAGGTEARRALLDGAPELQRLLDALGRGDSRIVVRDLAGQPVAATQQSSSSSGSSAGQSGSSSPQTPGSSDLAGGAGTDAGRPGADRTPDRDRHHAPGSTTATDGIPVATTPSRRTETVTRARAGLDVTL